MQIFIEREKKVVGFLLVPLAVATVKSRWRTLSEKLILARHLRSIDLEGSLAGRQALCVGAQEHVQDAMEHVAHTLQLAVQLVIRRNGRVQLEQELELGRAVVALEADRCCRWFVVVLSDHSLGS